MVKRCGFVVSVFCVAMFVSVLLSGAGAQAAIAVGSGESTSNVVINFGDGAEYHFEVAWDGSPDGFGLLDIMEAATTLTTVRQSFDFGGGPVVFLDGISFEGHSDIGYGGGDNWWHYWVGGPGNWSSPFDFGADDNLAVDGSWEGWVYGSALEPSLPSAVVPEPASMVMAVVGLAVGVTGRRRLGRGL
jgi:hypothetical protein